ncbi:hypothetical protein [Blastopirellula marina]|uniref:Uncharacterized protein n=1 Tax=Blastopirellula marina TaxID=124 RepID=A0A2S8GT87_9BACT|nr:hypothetical protein [Blastopirellula marina]PQO47622.1 hypothetical protein C5Y93_02905 [Blastopirellula marina]
MGRFLGFALLAVVALVTLAILFRGESLLTDAVNQTKQAAKEWTPQIEPPEPEPEQPPPPKIELQPFPDTTRILGAERRAAYRTKERFYAYVEGIEPQFPYRKIQYADLEGMLIIPLEHTASTSLPRARAHVNVYYRVSGRYRSQQEALLAPLEPNVFKELFAFEFAWTGTEWVIDSSKFEHSWAQRPNDPAFLARRPAHIELVKHQFQEFEITEVPIVAEPTPSDNPYGSAVSQTAP